MSTHVVRMSSLDALRLTLDAPKGNVLDGAMIASLTRAFEVAAHDQRLRAIVIDAAGDDFCFGASVAEHLPESAPQMLRSLHHLLLTMLEAPVPVLIAVQGRCLGGGLELALAGSRIIAAPNALFGQPEVKLGLFAPAASALLPERVGQHAAEELLVTGRTVKAPEALALGLIDELATERTPLEQASAWIETNLMKHSRTGLRFACRAARLQHAARVGPLLKLLERLYLEELMVTPDAIEGLNAFLQKRAAQWQGVAT